MKLISLTTDFGLQDGYVGVMKVVIYGIAPQAKIVDISHQVSPQNILQGGWALIDHVTYFPADSIHIVVVDPGVGTARRPIAAKIGTQYYVAPDNGVLSPLIALGRQNGWPMEFVSLDKPSYWLARISHTFHGRDIFSPVGAHLANGIPLAKVGTLINDPVVFTLPTPEIKSDSIVGEVIYVDHFGNLRTNISVDDLGKLDQTKYPKIMISQQLIEGFVQTFGEAPAGSLIALLHSSGFIGLSIVNGSAASMLDVTIGEQVTVINKR